ncbi:MAG: aminodeoxychorismate synthase component I [Bacteroidaceae bacterium]
MKGCTKEEAIARINEWAKEREPFVFIINYAQDCSFVERASLINAEELLYDLNGFSNMNRLSSKDFIKNEQTESVLWKVSPISYLHYKQEFDYIRAHILEGNSYLANLTAATPVATNVGLKELFYRSKALYRLYLKDRFVVFSPEIFIRIQQGKICSFPMKGTIDATLPNAQQLLLNDGKEAAEHATITDLIRNDLSCVATHVSVERYRYIDRLQTNRGPILQTSSEVCGDLSYDYLEHLGEILFQLLPAGSITGAPKKKTMEIIAEAEDYDRGFYTGVMGYFDGKRLDSAVMIRFLEQTERGFLFKSGGGITSQSVAEKEYEELKQKVYVPIY